MKYLTLSIFLATIGCATTPYESLSKHDVDKLCLSVDDDHKACDRDWLRTHERLNVIRERAVHLRY